ncbi:tetratricopeptide repeat protein [Bradyrhizobium liaoningense]|uniref:tetratricopeptide repeat protein n=1 Tax=Bradyrhizobium liaoningense TaxID=43992 RepID=UPI001BA755F8|nr:tetratricopeptide repeat protein [Bradyrhizobium liaoningense]MBR0839663.1 tetratricopeptide repeat protein [Bradyrhizobium liaoningense]
MNRRERRSAAKRGQISLAQAASFTSVHNANAAEQFESGIWHHQAGRLAEAEACYQRTLATQPNHPDALYHLGLIARQVGRADLAVDLLGKAIRLKRTDPIYFLYHATTLQELARHDEALASYDKALVLLPDHAEIFYNRGLVLKALGRFEEALANLERASALKPEFAEAWNNCGVLQQQMRLFDRAIASLDRAVTLNPAYAEAFHNRGVTLQELGRLEEALADHDAAIALAPDFAEAHSYRGVALQGLRRLDEAIASFDAALTLRPEHADIHNNRAIALLQMRRYDEVLKSLTRAVTIAPDFVEAHHNIGCVLMELKRFKQALVSLDTAVALEPDYVDALNSRGVALQEMKQFGRALEDFERAHQLAADHPNALSGMMLCAGALCDWDRRASLADAAMARIRDGKPGVMPFTLLGYTGDLSLQFRCTENLVPAAAPLWTGEVRHHDRIRIAYLSADFHNHATAHLMAGLFERHDRARFEIIGVSSGPDDGSAYRQRLTAAFDRFYDISEMSDAAVAGMLHEMEVDIAVDLKGHTKDARLEILAHRPAPVQVSYLGYPSSTGADFIDYVIADATVAPFGHQAFYSEKIVHLPHSYQANDSTRSIAAHTPTRQDAGLPERGFVFCCFNQSWKIGPETFDVWMRLLGAVEGSVLWLLADHEPTMQNLRCEAEKRGVDPARLVFARPLPPEDHLARHRLADLFLDTLPYNAHTTASDALWAGLPVLTQLGEGFAGRVGASLLNAVGLPELVTHSIADYETLARELAVNPARLAELRDRLAANRLTHPLFDTDRFRRHIEAAYLQMWDIARRGEPPQNFAVQE